MSARDSAVGQDSNPVGILDRIGILSHGMLPNRAWDLDGPLLRGLTVVTSRREKAPSRGASFRSEAVHVRCYQTSVVITKSTE
jgi:hypothetical protein